MRVQVHDFGEEAGIVTINKSRLQELLDGSLPILRSRKISFEDVVLVFNADHYSGTCHVQHAPKDDLRDSDDVSVLACCPDWIKQ